MVPIQLRRVDQAGGDWTSTVSIDQIDPATIVSARVTLAAGVQETVSIRSFEGAASTVRSTAAALVVLSAPGVPSLLATNPTATVSGILGAATGGQDGASFAGTGTGTGSSGVGFGPGAGPGGFLAGSGTALLGVSAATRVQAETPGNMQATVRTQVSAVVRTEVVTRDPPPGGSNGGGPYGGGGQLAPVPYVPPFGASSTPVQTQSLAEQTTGRNALLAFQQFNASLGTLQAVYLTLTVTSHGSYMVENDTGMVTTLNLQQAAAFKVLRADGTSAASATTASVTPLALAASTTLVTGTTTGTTTQTAALSGADLAGYIGTGSAILAVSGTGTDTINGPGAFAIGTTLTSGLVAQLSYLYTPGGAQTVPVPDASVISAGQTRFLSPGTVTAVAPGGKVVIESGRTAPFTVYGDARVEPQSVVIGQQTIKGTLTVAATSRASSAIVAVGGTLIDDGAIELTEIAGLALVRGTAVNSLVSGNEYVFGQSTNSIVLPGGREIVSGRAMGLQIQGGEAQIVAGGTADVRLGAGRVTVEAGGSLSALAFVGAGTLTINGSGTVGPITGFAAGDTINLASVSFTAATSATYSGGMLRLQDGTALQINASAGTSFRLAAGIAGVGTAITLEAGLSMAGPVSAAAEYRGPVDGIESQFIDLAPNTVVGASTDNWYLHAGGGFSALSAHGGRNVLDGGTGSSFLVGGTGQNTFFATAPAGTPTWTTIVGHAGDDVTLWGFGGAQVAFLDGQGATGYTGLTLALTQAGIESRVTLAGYTSADLAANRVTIGTGIDVASGLTYVHMSV